MTDINTDETIEIFVEEYKKLVSAHQILNALIEGGVDSWSGYKDVLQPDYEDLCKNCNR